ncbi:MAG: polysaccharide biosynthesis C-terminal domain-containing protein [Flavobacteriales bacterium]
MGIVQKDAIKTSMLSFVGLVLGYLNKGFLFILLFSTAQVGVINLLLNVGLLFAQFANLGTTYSTWRFFPFFRNAAKKHYGFLLANSLLVAFGIVLFGSLLYGLQDVVLETYREKSSLFTSYFHLILPLGVALVYFQLFENYLRGLKQNILPVFLQEIILRFCTTLLLGAYWLNVVNFYDFIWAYIFIHFIPTLYLFVYLLYHKELTFSISHIQIPKKFQGIMLSYTGFSYVNALATLLVISMDALMIAKFEGLSETGIYTTMLFLISAIIFPYRAILRVATPLVALQWKERNKAAMQSLYQKSSSVGLLLSLAGFLVVWSVIDELFTFIPAYAAGKWVFFFLMLGRIVDMYFGLNAVIFSTSKKYKVDLFFTLFLILGVYFANLWLIPLFGMTGAAISTSVAYLFYNVLRGFYIYKEYNLSPFTQIQLRLFLLAIVTFCGINLFNEYLLVQLDLTTISSIVLKEVLLALVFFIPIYIWNLEPETVNYIHKTWNKWRRN